MAEIVLGLLAEALGAAAVMLLSGLLQRWVAGRSASPA